MSDQPQDVKVEDLSRAEVEALLDKAKSDLVSVHAQRERYSGMYNGLHEAISAFVYDTNQVIEEEGLSCIHEDILRAARTLAGNVDLTVGLEDLEPLKNATEEVIGDMENLRDSLNETLDSLNEQFENIEEYMRGGGDMSADNIREAISDALDDQPLDERVYTCIRTLRQMV